MAEEHLQIRAAFTATNRFVSNYDGTIDTLDSYVDLADFAQQLVHNFTNKAAVVSAAETLQEAIADAVVSTGYTEDKPNGTIPPVTSWSDLGGLSIYLPLGQPEERQNLFYTAVNLGLGRGKHMG